MQDSPPESQTAKNSNSSGTSFTIAAGLILLLFVFGAVLAGIGDSESVPRQEHGHDTDLPLSDGTGLPIPDSPSDIKDPLAATDIPETSTTASPVEAATPTTTRPSTTTTRPSTSTTRPSTTTTTSGGTGTTIPTNAVVVTPGTNVQSLVNSNPAGTTFYFRAGTYNNLSIVPKAGNTFIGEPGAIMNGGGSTRNAVKGDVNNVTISGFIVERYNNPAQEGAITGYGTGWRILNNEVRFNEGAGIQAYGGFLIQGNNVHHNEQIGVVGRGSNARLINNTIAHNNPNNKYNPNWEAGGTKFLYTTNLQVSGNNVHNNRGPGLWTDHNNTGTIYENNTVRDNFGPGIFHEISYSATIRNNTVTGNAHGFYVGGILVANSNDVEVYGNTVSGNHGGIVGIQDNRGEGSYATTGLKVYNNTITINKGYNGVRVNSGQDVTQTGTISWNNNTYNITNLNQPFYWRNAGHTTQSWRNLGHDTHSAFN